VDLKTGLLLGGREHRHHDIKDVQGNVGRRPMRAALKQTGRQVGNPDPSAAIAETCR
jgi:hypothetical protein